MSFKRKNGFMSTYRGRVRKRSRGYSSNIINKKTVANIRKGFGIENKFKDNELTTTTLVAAVAGSEVDPALDCINGVALGDTESSRDGRRYKMNTIHIRGVISSQSTAGASGAKAIVCRLAIVIDSQTNKLAMNAEDCFLAPAEGSLSPYAFRNLRFSGRFHVLYDKSYTLQCTASSGNGTANDHGIVARQFKLNLKIPEKYCIVETDGDTADVDVITNNSIHVLAFVDDVSVVTTTIEYISRLRYVG